MIVYLENLVDFHYETIETFLLLFKQHILYLAVLSNPSFFAYIKSKYPKVRFSTPKKYDVFVCLTVYDNQYHAIKQEKNHFYVAHEITERLKKLPNVLFLTPLCKKNYMVLDKLPFREMKRPSDIAIYVIQGDPARRNLDLLDKILSKTYKYPFIIKILCRKTNGPYHKHIVYRLNLDFIDFHKEFLDAYCIIPLITKKSHPQYYKNKLTSSINYSIGYNLKCLIDKDLQDIYHLKNVEVFHEDIQRAFENTLKSFYENT